MHQYLSLSGRGSFKIHDIKLPSRNILNIDKNNTTRVLSKKNRHYYLFFPSGRNLEMDAIVQTKSSKKNISVFSIKKQPFFITASAKKYFQISISFDDQYNHQVKFFYNISSNSNPQISLETDKLRQMPCRRFRFIKILFFFLPKTPYYIFFSFSIYTKYDVQYMHIVDDDEEEEEKKKNNS